MITAYQTLLLVHILGATLIFGTGLGTAYFMWQAHRSKDAGVIHQTARQVVLADWIFTAPAVVMQPLTGVMLARITGVPVLEGWMAIALALYVLAGACWLPVVWIQIRVRDLAEAAAASDAELPPRYHRFMRVWFALGWPAFFSVLAIFYLMVFKPAL